MREVFEKTKKLTLKVTQSAKEVTQSAKDVLGKNLSQAKNGVINSLLTERTDESNSSTPSSDFDEQSTDLIGLNLIENSNQNTPSPYGKLEILTTNNSNQTPFPSPAPQLMHEEPNFCIQLQEAIANLAHNLEHQDQLNNQEALLDHCSRLVVAAEQATKINIIFTSTVNAQAAGFTDCYIWDIIGDNRLSNSETKESDKTQPVYTIKMSYIAADGGIETIETYTSFNLISFLHNQGILVRQTNDLLGATCSTAVFQSFLKNIAHDWADSYIKKITELTIKVQLACEELAYHLAIIELSNIITSEPTIEYPECGVYFMDFPETKQSRFRDCYIWNATKLIYIPPESSDDSPFEYVNIKDHNKLLAGINELTKNPMSVGYITLSNTLYADIIQGNGGHAYYARKQHDTLFNKAKEILQKTQDEWHHHSQSVFDIVCAKPNANQIRPNTLYIYQDNSNFYYTLKSIPAPHPVQTQETLSSVERFMLWMGIKEQPTSTHSSIHLTEEIINAVLDLTDYPELKTQLTHVMAGRQLSTSISENTLWTILYAQNKNITPMNYRPKKPTDLEITRTLLNQINDPLQELKLYIEIQTDDLQARCDIEKETLRQQINDDVVFNSLTHSIEPKDGIKLYKKCQKLYELIPETEPYPKPKRLAMAINRQIGAMQENIPEFKSNCLPICELPTALRQMNAPAPTQTTQQTERQFNVSLMVLGVGLIAASIALFILSHGFSAQLTFQGITLGTHLLFNMTLAGFASGACTYATGVFFGPKKVIIPNDNDPAVRPRGFGFY